MAHVTYKVVRHEDGWAYTVNGAFSESFPTHAEARPSNMRTSEANGTPNSCSAATGRRPR